MPTSQLEEWTREYFETKFKKKFPNTRPDWLLNKKTGRNLELDGLNMKIGLAFEAQGMQHYKRVAKFQATPEAFETQIAHDLEKELKCIKKGIRLIKVPPLKNKEEVWNFLDMQFMNIKDHLNQKAKNSDDELVEEFVHMTVEETRIVKARPGPKARPGVKKNHKRSESREATGCLIM